jgi:ABC-type phosphate transport system substrate-binding protein
MFKPTLVTLALGLSALLLVGCTTKTQPQADSAPQKGASSSVAAKGKSASAAKEQRVTLYVEGMTKVQGIT